MANQVFVSAGVFTREFDLSFVPTGVSQIGASVVGLTPKGPAFQPIQITSFDEFRSLFGNINDKYYLPYTVREYLKNAGVITVTRVLGENSSTNIGSPFYIQFPASGVTGAANAVTNTVLSTLRARNTNITNVFLKGWPSNFSLTTVSGATISAITGLSLDYTSSRYIRNVLGNDPLTAYSGDSLPGVYVDAVFDFSYSQVSGTANYGAISSSSASTVAGNYQNARSPYVVSQNYNGSVYNLFTVYSRSDGNESTDDVKISITNVAVDTATEIEYPAFTIQVRDFYDTDSNPIVLESYNVSLDPTSNDYIAQVIGDRYPTYDTTGSIPVVMQNGNFNNNSKYIYVVMESGYPATARPCGFQKFPGNGLGIIPQYTYKADNVNTVTNSRDNRVFMGVNILADTAAGFLDRLKYGTTLVTANPNVNNKGFIVAATTNDLTNISALSAIYEYVDVTSSGTSVTAGSSYVNTIKFTFPLYGGWDSLDPRSDVRLAQNDGTLLDEYTKAIDILSNADEYDFNLFVMPGVNSCASGNPVNRAIDMVSNRGDAVVLFDLASSNTDLNSGRDLTISQALTQIDSFDSNYAATYYPWVRIADPDVAGKKVWVPPTTVVLGAYAFNDRVAQPYYAPAGYNRGVLSSVLETRRKLSITDRNSLYLKNINPIANFPGEGTVIFGQKTTQQIASALDRVNVRRLLIVMKKIIASTGRQFLFEANNQRTRDQILNILNPAFARIQRDNGLEEFRIVMDETVNTPDIIDRNMLVGKVYLKPTKTAEIFIIDLNITSSGASFTEA